MKQISAVMLYVTAHSDEIAVAHDKLGVTLEELICSSVKKALSLRAIEAEGQLALFAPQEAAALQARGAAQARAAADAKLQPYQEEVLRRILASTPRRVRKARRAA